MNTDLARKAMLVRLTISQWTAKKHDRHVSAHVAAEYNAALESGRYNKALLAKEAVDTVATLVNEARAYHYQNTLPWQDDGRRILRAANFQRYSEGMRELHARFDAAVSAFVANYPTFVDEARGRLNGLFRAEDYPSPQEIRRRYSFAVAVDPLPTAPDFRVSLSAAEEESIRAEISARLAEGEALAMRDLWQRLHDVVARAAERLGDPKAIFRDTLVENARELVALLPRLNLTGDPDLERLRGEVAAALCRWDPQELRDDRSTRTRAALECESILADLVGYLGGDA